MVCSTALTMRLPPGVPSTSTVWPSFVTMVGVIELSGRLAGAIAFASPCTRPYRLGTPGLIVKSSISLFSSTPVPAAVTLAPNQSFSVYVTATALPQRSAIE